jgi:hypothetical protein
METDLGVTVLLPVFFRNTNLYDCRMLKRAIESVHAQEFPGPYEILIVDDGGDTPIEQLVDNLATPATRDRLRFIRNERNSGLVYSLNRGLAASRYPFVARLDADDRWLAGKIRKQFELFLNDPDLSITATGMTLVTPDGEPIETHVRPGDWTGILHFFIDVGCPFPHGSVLARRYIYQLLGGYPHDPHLSHCEDYALWGIWLRFFKPAMVEEALYDYTVSSTSVSAQHGAQQGKASGEVNRRFRAVSALDSLPDALSTLAAELGVSVLEAGMLAYRMWRFRLTLGLPGPAIEALRVMLPDRYVLAAPASSVATPLDTVIGRRVDVPRDGLTIVQAV